MLFLRENTELISVSPPGPQYPSFNEIIMECILRGRFLVLKSTLDEAGSSGFRFSK